MKQPDRRVQRTQQAFSDALVELIEEKGYASVTIKDITEHANTAYATFFRHYDGKDALLMACFSDIVKHIETRPDFSLKQEGQLIFEHVRDHQGLYRSLLTVEASRAILNHLKLIIIDYVQDHAQWVATAQSNIPEDIRLNQMAASVLELIAWWLEHDMSYEIDQMAMIYEQVIVKARL